MLRAVSVDFDTIWRNLGDVVYRLLRCQPVGHEPWYNSFTDVYSLCVSRPVSHFPILYSSTNALIGDRVAEIVAELSALDDIELLPAYVERWEVFHTGLTCVDSLYRFVNQQYVKNQRPTEAEMCYGASLLMVDQYTMEIMEVGLAFWKRRLFDVLGDRLSSCLMREVLNDRMSISGQQTSIHPCLVSVMLVGELRDSQKSAADLYNEIFQDHLLEATRYFYTQWASQRESELSCSEYVTEALVLRAEERNRAMLYYKYSTEPIEALFQEIIVEQRLNFLNCSVRSIVVNENKTDLKNMYQLLAPNNLCSELLHWFGEHVKCVIRDTIANLSKDPLVAQTQFVENLLSLRNRFLAYIEEVFDGVSAFRNQMDKAFNLAINERCTQLNSVSTASKVSIFRPSELLSRYMDSLLRKSVKNLSISEAEAKLSASIIIFKYIDDKDLFQKFYQRMLCKRLIFNFSFSILELEESLINQLRTVCGYEFTAKFQRMFNDVQLTSELNRNFLQYLQTNNMHFKFGHHFHVLTQCSWPISLTGTAEFLLPPELQSCTSQFEAFYSAAYQGRKMLWAHNYSTVELNVFCTDKIYQLQAPALHATILLFFDKADCDRVTVKDLLNGLQITVAETKPSGTVNPSTTGQDNRDVMDTSVPDTTLPELDMLQKVLVPLFELGIIYPETSGGTPKSGSNAITVDTGILLNRAFTKKRLKLRVTFGSHGKESTQTEADQVDRQVNEDRRYFIQAAIVRILKTRKQIKHSALIEAVLQQASNRFQPPVPLIKRCVEGLIDTGYIERNPDDPDQYSYLA